MCGIPLNSITFETFLLLNLLHGSFRISSFSSLYRKKMVSSRMKSIRHNIFFQIHHNNTKQERNKFLFCLSSTNDHPFYFVNELHTHTVTQIYSDTTPYTKIVTELNFFLHPIYRATDSRRTI